MTELMIRPNRLTRKNEIVSPTDLCWDRGGHLTTWDGRGRIRVSAECFYGMENNILEGDEITLCGFALLVLEREWDTYSYICVKNTPEMHSAFICHLLERQALRIFWTQQSVRKMLATPPDVIGGHQVSLLIDLALERTLQSYDELAYLRES